MTFGLRLARICQEVTADFKNFSKNKKRVIHMNGCCGTCKYGHYDKMQGYVCVNDESEYIADFVEYEHETRRCA